MSAQALMLAVVALNNRQYSYHQLLLLCGLSDQSLLTSGRIVNPPDMPRTPMLSGYWSKTLSTTHRTLSSQTYVIIYTSFFSSMVCTVFYRNKMSHKWPLVPKLVLTSLILFSFSIKLKTCVYVFQPPSPDIKMNLICYALGAPPTPLNFWEGWKTYTSMQQIGGIIPHMGVILTGYYNSARFLMIKHAQGEKINLTLWKCTFKQ